MSIHSVGIDIGKRKHEATMIDANGDSLGPSVTFAHSPQGVAKLLDHVAKFPADQVVFGLEATGRWRCIRP